MLFYLNLTEIFIIQVRVTLWNKRLVPSVQEVPRIISDIFSYFEQKYNFPTFFNRWTKIF
jgi:hypothetical protein